VHLELDPRGPLLVTRHADQPGVVGLLGTLLGRHGVNIRRIELGPLGGARSGQALGFLALYADPPAAALDELAAVGPVYSVRLVRW
jgi:D-3-phosphoglycerate dehydrogenase